MSRHKGAFWANLRNLGVSSGGSLKSGSAFSDILPLETLGLDERICEIWVFKMSFTWGHDFKPQEKSRVGGGFLVRLKNECVCIW